MRKTVVTLVLALVPVSLAHAQIPTAERDALIALYNSTDGDNWLDKTNWLGAVGTECSWFGVVCDGTPNVQQLSLVSNQLNGSIAPELEDLSILTDLDLNTNLLSGSIPMELKNLENLSYLNLSFNLLGGSIPPELGSLSSLTDLNLRANQLNGSIPPELGDLSSLTLLNLRDNQLSGNIPAELGKLSSLTQLSLGSNRLSGSIPAELGSLSSLLRLYLHSNQLSGSIPAELGNLPSLERFVLRSNRLSGSIPSELENLSTLQDGRLDFSYNALHSDIATLIAFLNSKQNGGDWQSTQTIAPENLTVDSLGDHTVWLSWDTVSYQSDPGGYSVFSAPTGTGVWTSHGWTESKTTTTYPATGLDPAITYDFALVTYTDPHANNLNLVNSDFSAVVMATTASGGCSQPVIDITWEDPIVLSVSGSWDSYSWSTGETTSTIDVNPPSDQWYWVTVTSTGPCEETGAIWVDPTTPIFLDGFESGNTSEWSSAVP